MGIGDYFRKVGTVRPEELKAFLDAHGPEAYNLVDVRSPTEYARGHLPGARLMPLSELPQRLHELDAAKPTYVY